MEDNVKSTKILEAGRGCDVDQNSAMFSVVVVEVSALRDEVGKHG